MSHITPSIRFTTCCLFGYSRYCLARPHASQTYSFFTPPLWLGKFNINTELYVLLHTLMQQHEHFLFIYNTSLHHLLWNYYLLLYYMYKYWFSSVTFYNCSFTFSLQWWLCKNMKHLHVSCNCDPQRDSDQKMCDPVQTKPNIGAGFRVFSITLTGRSRLLVWFPMAITGQIEGHSSVD